MYQNVKLNSCTSTDCELRRVFNDNGDGVVDYTVVQVAHQQDGQLHYLTTGKWSHTAGLKLDKLKLDVRRYESHCQSQFECDQCFTSGSQDKNKTQTATTDKRELNIDSTTQADKSKLLIAVGLLAAVILIMCIVLALITRAYYRNKHQTEPHYLDPFSLKSQNKEKQKTDTYLTCINSQTSDDVTPPPCSLTPSQQFSLDSRLFTTGPEETSGAQIVCVNQDEF